MGRAVSEDCQPASAVLNGITVTKLGTLTSHLIISKALAQSTGREAEYSKNKPFSDTFCCDLIIKALQEHRSLPRHKVNELVLEYLPKGQSEQNKIYKVGNLLSKLKRQGKIFLNDHKEWELSK